MRLWRGIDGGGCERRVQVLPVFDVKFAVAQWTYAAPPSELACGGPTTSGRTRKGGRQTEWPKGARGTEQKPNLSSRND